MWLFTTFGCFSIVQKPGTPGLTVRARVRGDLDRLREGYLPELGPTLEGGGTDYPYRAAVPHEAFARALAQIGREIHYSNFKNETVRQLGAMRGAVYHDVWQSVAKLETLDAVPVGQSSGGDRGPVRPKGAHRPKATSARRPAHGGVVFDSRGRVLLFRPRGGFGAMLGPSPKGGRTEGRSRSKPPSARCVRRLALRRPSWHRSPESSKETPQTRRITSCDSCAIRRS